MPWDLKNVALDPTHAMKRRTAARMEMEPTIAGVRLRLRQKITISDEAYEINKVRIALCIKHGVITAQQTNAAPTPTTAQAAAPAASPEAPAELPPPPSPSESESPEPDEPSDDEFTPVEIPKASSKKKKSKRGKR